MYCNKKPPVRKMISGVVASVLCLGLAYGEGLKFSAQSVIQQNEMPAFSALLKQHVVALPKQVKQADIQSTHLTQASYGVVYITLVTHSGQVFIFKSRHGRYGVSPYGFWVKPVLPDLSRGSYRVHDALVSKEGVLALATDIGLFRAKDVRFGERDDNQLSLSRWVFKNDFPEADLQSVSLYSDQTSQDKLCVFSQHNAACAMGGGYWQAVGMPTGLSATNANHYKIVGTAPAQQIKFSIQPNKQGYQPKVVVKYYSNTGQLLKTDDHYDATHNTVDVAGFFQQANDGKIEDPYWYKNHQLGRVEIDFNAQKGDVLTKEAAAQFEVDLDVWSPYVNNQAGQIKLSTQPLLDMRDGWQLAGTLKDSQYQLQLTVPQSAGTAKTGAAPLPASWAVSSTNQVHMEFSFGSGTQHTVYDNGLQQLPVYVTVCDDNQDQFTADQILPYLRVYDGDNHQSIGWLQSENGGLYTPYANNYQHGRYAMSLAQARRPFSLGDSTSCEGNTGARTLTFYLQSDRDSTGKGIYAVYKYLDARGQVKSFDTTKTVASTTFSVIPGHFNFPTSDFSVENCSKSGDPELNYHGYTAHYGCDLIFTKQPGEQIPGLHDIYYSEVSGMPFGDGKSGSPFRLLEPAISGQPHEWKLSFIRPAVEDSLKASLYMKGHDEYGNDVIINHIGAKAATGQYEHNFSLPEDHLDDLEGILMGVVGQSLKPAFNNEGGKWQMIFTPPGSSTVTKTLCYNAKTYPNGPYCFQDNYFIFPGNFNYSGTKDRDDFRKFVSQIDAYTGANGSGSDVKAVTASGAGDGGLSQFVDD